MPQSLTSSRTDKVRRHFTERWKIFTGNATITDVFTDGKSPSAFYRELKDIYWICHYHRRNTSVGIFLVRNVFFCVHFLSVKPSAIFFFTDRVGDGMWDYQRKECRRTLSVGDLVGKKFTDEFGLSVKL